MLAVVALASIAAQLALDDPNRAYLGTDARAAELAVGALAAVVWQGWRGTSPGLPSRRAALDVAAVLAAAALLGSWRVVHLGDALLLRGGLVAHAALAAVVVAAAVRGRWVPVLGRVGPLVALGRISYPTYVVHVPLFLWLDEAPLVTRLAATAAVAVAVHVTVERPVRWGGSLPGHQAPLALAAALGAVLVLAVGVPRATDDGSTAVVAGRPTVVTMPVPMTARLPTGPAQVAAPPTPTTPATPPPRLLVVGDSTGLATGTGMQRWASASGAAVVDVVGHYGCTFLQDGQLKVRKGWVQPASPECLALLDVAVETAAATHPDAVVLFVGTMQLGEWDLDGNGTWRSVGDPVYDERYRAAAAAALDRLAGLGVPVLWTDLPVPAWVPEASGGVLPGTGAPTINQPDRVARLAALTSVVVAGRSGVRVVEYARFLAGPDGQIPASTRPDGLHVDEDAVPAVMEAGFAGALRTAYQEVVAPGAPATAWSRSCPVR